VTLIVERRELTEKRSNGDLQGSAKHQQEIEDDKKKTEKLTSLVSLLKGEHHGKSEQERGRWKKTWHKSPTSSRELDKTCDRGWTRMKCPQDPYKTSHKEGESQNPLGKELVMGTL